MRLNCRESIKLISNTKKFLSGDFKTALSNNDKRTDFVLEDHNNMLEAEDVAKECVKTYDHLIQRKMRRESKHIYDDKKSFNSLD